MPKKPAGNVAPITINIALGPLSASSKVQDEQVCRLLANLGNQVVTWLRYDVEDTLGVPVICSEGNIEWKSKTGKCRSIAKK